MRGNMTPKEIVDILDELRDMVRTSNLYDNPIIISSELCDEIINTLCFMIDVGQEK